MLALPATAQTTLPAMTRDAGDPAKMTCQGMMENVSATVQPASAKKKALADEEMRLAKVELVNNRETSCKMHMQNAMKDME